MSSYLAIRNRRRAKARAARILAGVALAVLTIHAATLAIVASAAIGSTF